MAVLVAHMRCRATEWRHLAPYIDRLRALPSFVEVNAWEGLTDWLNPD